MAGRGRGAQRPRGPPGAWALARTGWRRGRITGAEAEAAELAVAAAAAAAEAAAAAAAAAEVAEV